MSYFVYMLECVGGSYYIGITTDLAKRFRTHLSGKGSAYTRSHPPIRIVYSENVLDKSQALKRELELKKLSHSAKQKLTLL